MSGELTTSLPKGGAPGQVLTKVSYDNYKVAWMDSQTENIDSPAHSINDTMGPQAVVSTDMAAAGSRLRPVSEIQENAEGIQSVSLTQCGKNLFDQEVASNFVNYTLATDVASNAPQGPYAFEINVKAGISYTFSLKNKVLEEYQGYTSLLYFGEVSGGEYRQLKIMRLLSNKTNTYNEKFSFVAESDAKYYVLIVKADITAGNYIPAIQLELGAESTPLVAYQGDTVTQALPETVYGGSYDWAKGELTVTHGLSEGGVVEALVEPRIIQLTPREFTSLSGINTLFSNCGDTTVTFTADLKKYIDSKLAELAGGAQNEA